MNRFELVEAHLMIPSREVDSEVIRMAILYDYFYEEKAK